MKQYNGQLPTVGTDVGSKTLEEMAQNRKEYVISALQKLEESNPVLAEFVRQYSSAVAKTKKEKVNIASAVAIAYKLLESQTEADKMEKEIIL